MFSNAKKCGEGQVSGMSEGQEELLRMEGVIEHVIYENQDSGYAVFEVNAGGEVHVVTGVVGEVNPGESVTLYGKFETHPAHGPQFRAATCEASMPQDLAATLAYLSSGALPYIGPATAKKLVEKFGADSLEVIANEPLRLTELRGITPDKAAAISNEFKRMFGVREAVAYLGRFGISPARAVEVYRHLGPATVEAVPRPRPPVPGGHLRGQHAPGPGRHPGLSFKRGAALHRPGHGEKAGGKVWGRQPGSHCKRTAAPHRAAGDHAGQGGRDFE